MFLGLHRIVHELHIAVPKPIIAKAVSYLAAVYLDLDLNVLTRIHICLIS